MIDVNPQPKLIHGWNRLQIPRAGKGKSLSILYLLIRFPVAEIADAGPAMTIAQRFSAGTPSFVYAESH
jgi:hypothetical protein